MVLDETRTAGESGHLADHNSLHDFYNAAVTAGAFDEATGTYKDTSLPVLYLPGVSGNYPSTPDHADLDLGDAVELVLRVGLDDYTPSAAQELIAKSDATSAATTAYRLFVNTSGALGYQYGDGTSGVGQNSSAPGLTDGTTYWLKVVHVRSTGALTFYKADDQEDEPSAWTQISTHSITVLASRHNSPGNLLVGTINATANWLTGKVLRAIVRAGAGGTTVADLRCDLGNVSPRYRDSTGKVWTFNGSAYSWTGR